MTRVNAPGGTGGQSSIAFTNDAPAEVRRVNQTQLVSQVNLAGAAPFPAWCAPRTEADADGMCACVHVCVCVCAGDNGASRTSTTRVNVPGGTGGTSSISFTNDEPVDARLSTRTNRPGGTGGASSFALSDEPEVRAGRPKARRRTPRPDGGGSVAVSARTLQRPKGDHRALATANASHFSIGGDDERIAAVRSRARCTLDAVRPR